MTNTNNATESKGNWFLALRPWSFPASAVPVAVGGATALAHPQFSTPVFAATLAGAVMVHAAANLANTYFDFTNRLDTKEHSDDRTLVDEWFPSAAVLKASIALFAASAALGLFLSRKAGLPMICMGTAGLALAYFYTAGNVKYKYRGLGEAGIFICFGPLLAVGSAMVQTGDFVPLAFFLSIPVGLHVAAILHANNMRDEENDRRAGAATLAQRIGPDNSFRLYFFLILAAYAFLLAGAFMYSKWLMLPALSLPTAGKLVREAKNRELAILPQKTAQFITMFGILLIAGVLMGR